MDFTAVDGRPSQDELLEAHLPLTDAELFRLGLEELLFVNPVFGIIARGMGMPVWDEEQETAYVTYDEGRESIVFAMNPTFIRSITTEECAAVIAHETHHVVLEHLEDYYNPYYTDRGALVKAQECIINDTVASVLQLPLPPIGVLRGEDVVGEDCTHLTTRALYDRLAQKQEDQDGPGDGDDGGGQSDEGQGSPGCGGVRVEEDLADAMGEALKALIDEAAEEQGMTEEEMVEALTNSTGGGYSPTGAPTSEQASASKERMNWRSLLARINPKVLEAGKPPTARNDWTRYNRRMGSVYPRVIMPVTKYDDAEAKEKGSVIPSMVIALDLSGSIDRSLVKMLQGMLEDIPEDLIQAYPCTWGSQLYPYVPKGRVAGGGTNINLVSAYVRKVAKETGTEPYVLVITDGEFTRRFDRPGREWFFMGVNKASVRTIRNGSWGCGPHVGSDEEVYLVDDFRAR